MRFMNWLARRRFPYEPLIAVEISRSRLLHNLSEFARLSPGRLIAPVLKSNAYGHGLIEVAHILARTPGIPFFVVDSYFEAIALRAKHIRTPLLVIGYTRPETILQSHMKDVYFAVGSVETLKQLKNAPRDMHIHLKIDTGMHRQGILPEEIQAAIDAIHENPYIMLDGICTHLSDGDNADESFTEGQIKAWDKIVTHFRAVFPRLRYVHGAATDGSRFADLHGNVVRIGIGLYGLSENAQLAKSVQLQPVLSMKTIVTTVKNIRTGDTVGYGNTFRAVKDMKIGTIPVGYYEGLDRRLSSGPGGVARGFVHVGPDRIVCPIIGRVSMNIATIDISAVPEAAIGMEAVVISDNAVDPSSLINMAKSAGTITYEHAVRIPAQLKRVVVD